MIIEKEAPPHANIKVSFGRVALISVCVIVAAILIAAFSGCSSTAVVANHKIIKPNTKMARITYYTDHRTALGVKPRQGITCAAHPKYPFKKKVVIPDLYRFLGSKEFEIQDRGSAVTSMKASHGTADVIDIYVRNSRTMRWLEKDAPEYMPIEL